MQALRPHTFCPPPPQNRLPLQAPPQETVDPQALGAVPQSHPWATQVVGVQVPQTLVVPPPPQV